MSIEGILDSFNGFIDRLHKWPLLVVAILTSAHSVWMTLEVIKAYEGRVKDAKESSIVIKQLSGEALKQAQEKDVLKDSIISMKTRELDNLLKQLRP